ncbi:hypothetical protein MPSEU_000119400 [Mayamaea pseudoterrestris]|nr:hypothetical protein MPSEU_000119400 [Mayamaea pseudoterrestris]
MKDSYKASKKNKKYEFASTNGKRKSQYDNFMEQLQHQQHEKEAKQANEKKARKYDRSHNDSKSLIYTKKRPKQDELKDLQEHDGTIKMTSSSDASKADPQSQPSATAPKNDDIDITCKYILAPMVGASELAFRLLCRNYGATLAYTPMMAASEFAAEMQEHACHKNLDMVALPKCGFQTCRLDRPLVVHVSASAPDEFAHAVAAAAPYCDAVDLNLGCPQRTAYLGHFGSYLLDETDRDLVCSIVRAGVAAGRQARTPPLPIYCKIRLLETLEMTMTLCRQLAEAGASLIAIHARHRATWDRKGPGARDGPALLDQVAEIRKVLPSSVRFIANGNVQNYQHVLDNFEVTGADGIMSAEGLLDDPTLFLQRYGSLEGNGKKEITFSKVRRESPLLSPESKVTPCERELKLLEKVQSIERTERKLQRKEVVSEKKRQKLHNKQKYVDELALIQQKPNIIASGATLISDNVTLKELYANASNKINVAREYLSFVEVFPTSMRTVVFHIRRMLKELLTKYQLMEECIASESIDQVELLLAKLQEYQSNPDSFVYDRLKAQNEKEALERKQREEGKRKAYEARMMRKAKREGKADLHFYLHIGAAVPTADEVARLKQLDKESQMQAWRKEHSQHCMDFHLNEQGCLRSRSCAFLHVPVEGANVFNEKDEVAG